MNGRWRSNDLQEMMMMDDHQLFLYETTTIDDNNDDDDDGGGGGSGIGMTIICCENLQWKIPLLTLCNILSVSGTLKFNELKNGGDQSTYACEAIQWESLHRFLLESIFKSSSLQINNNNNNDNQNNDDDCKERDSLDVQRHINAIHSLYYNNDMNGYHSQTIINPPPNISCYLKQFIDLFELFSIKLYYISDEDAPTQFQVIQVQSDTTLSVLISSWFQKSPGKVIINKQPLKEWTKCISTVSFSHCSMENFIQNHSEDHLSALYYENKFMVVTKIKGTLHQMDIGHLADGYKKVTWKQFNPPKLFADSTENQMKSLLRMSSSNHQGNLPKN